MSVQQGNNDGANWPVLGCGVGLRTDHYDVILNEWPAMDWFEAVTENFMDSGGRPLHILEQVRRHYPVALHGVSLSIGSVDPLSTEYLKRLKALAGRIDPLIVSDHLCWSGVDRQQLHDLLPLPFTEEAIQHVVSRVQQVQEVLGRTILLENVSTYVTYRHSTLKEWEFLMAVARRSGCGILLDLNNIYVNARNHQFDPLDYLRGIDGRLVGQFHLAGHTDMGEFLFDTHGGEVINPVWDLYRKALEMWGKVSTLIEWDEHVPSFERLSAEAAHARVFYEKAAAATPLEYKAPQVEPHPAPAIELSKIPSLLETQRVLKSFIQPAVSRSTAAGPSLLNVQGTAAGEKRMEVYAGGYVARMRDALDDVYEAVHRILGEACFGELAQAYARAYPSSEYNLSLAGKHLPEFLETHEFTQKFPFLPDLARLERQVAAAFHAFDRTSLSPAELSRISPEDFENVRLLFQPSFSLLASPWPIYDLWQARKAEKGKIRVDFVDRPQQVLVGRKDLLVFCHLLEPLQYGFLELLLGKKTLGEACEIMASVEGGEELPVTEWFSRWMASGYLSAFEIYSPSRGR